MPLVSSGKPVTPHRRSPLPGGAIVPNLLLAALAAACVRPALTEGCPDIEPGDLVVSEIYGNQANSSYVQWIEVYNASDEPIPLAGLRFSFVRLDDTRPVAFLVRDEALEVAPGDYVVIGGGDLQTETYLDYDYTLDYYSKNPETQRITVRDLYGAARLRLDLCDVVLDKLVYAGLPNAGSLALDGARPPDAAANDDSRVGWCVDAREGPPTEIGLPGSPGEANPPCP